MMRRVLFLALLVALLALGGMAGCARPRVFLANGPTCPDSARFLYTDHVPRGESLTARAWCERWPQ